MATLVEKPPRPGGHPIRRAKGGIALLLFLVVSAPGASAAQSASSDDWDYPRVRPVEYALTTAAIVGATTLYFVWPAPEHPRWTARFALDEKVRDGLRFDGRSGRAAAAAMSDVLVAGLLVNVLAIEPVLAWNRRSPEVAGQLFAIHAQSVAYSSLLTVVVKYLVRRERPWSRTCEGTPDDPFVCRRDDRYESFFSGHTSAAFTAAGLTCARPPGVLYEPPMQIGACVGSLGAALAVGFFRIASDHHYLTDVIVGATVGSLAGVLLPRWLHYRRERSPWPGAFIPMAGPGHAGIGYLQAF